MAAMNENRGSWRMAIILLYVGIVTLTTLVGPAFAQGSYVWLYTKIVGQSSLSNASIVVTSNYAFVTFAVYTDYVDPMYRVEIFKDPETGGASVGSCLDLTKQPCYLKDSDKSSTHTYVAKVLDVYSTVYKTSNEVSITWIAATPGILTGTVTDTSGDAISGAVITATDYSGDYSEAGSYMTGTTDYNGNYTINIRPGTWNVWASANGYQDSPTVNDLVITSSQTKKQDFTLISTAESNNAGSTGSGSSNAGSNNSFITGTVTDLFTKRAIPGATVKAYNSVASSSGIADATGKYSISITTGTYTVAASATGYQDGKVEGVAVTQGQPANQDIQLRQIPATLTGTVTDSSGTIIPGATVVAASSGTVPGGYLSLTQMTDEKGTYSIAVDKGLPDTFTVTASAKGYNMSNPFSIALTPGQMVTKDFILVSSKIPWCKPLALAGYILTARLALSGNEPAAAVVGGVSSIISLADPPDSNFMVIAQPVVPAVPQVAAQGEVTQDLAGAWNDFLNNQVQVDGVAMAMITSRERAQGAADAGDTYWQTQQNEAAAGYASQLASILAAQPALRENLVNAWQTSGIPDIIITADDVRKYQADITANGLPANFTDTLTQMGADSTTIEQIRENIIAQNPDDVAGSVMGKLTDPALDSATQDAVQALNEIAASNVTQPSEPISSSTGTATEIPTVTAPVLGSGTTPIVTNKTPGFDISEAILVTALLVAGTLIKQKKR